MSQPHPLPATAPRCWQFHVPIDIAPMSPNRRLHPLARARLVKAARDAAWMVWASRGRPRAAGRVRLDYRVYRGRAMDDDNIAASCKALRDGLCTAALTPDDSPLWVAQGQVSQVIGPAFTRRPSVLITATEEA